MCLRVAVEHLRVFAGQLDTQAVANVDVGGGDDSGARSAIDVLMLIARAPQITHSLKS